MFYLADFKRRYEKELYKANEFGILPQQFRGGNQGSFLGYNSNKRPKTKQSLISNLQDDRDYIDRVKPSIKNQGFAWEGNRRMLNDRRGGEGLNKKTTINEIGKKEAELRLRDLNLKTPNSTKPSNKSLILPNSPQNTNKKIITSSTPQQNYQELILPKGTREAIRAKNEIKGMQEFKEKYPVPEDLEYKGLTDQNYKPLITSSTKVPDVTPTDNIKSPKLEPPKINPKLDSPKVTTKNNFKLGKKTMYGLAGVGTLGALYGLNKLRKTRNDKGQKNRYL